MKTYADVGRVYANWARGKQLDPEAGALRLKQALESYLALGNKSSAPSFYGLLAELEAMRPDLDRALTTIDAGLAMAEETGEHYTDLFIFFIADSAANSCWRDLPPPPLPPRKLFKSPSPSPRGKARGAIPCWPPTRSPSFTNQPADQTTPKRSSRRRSKASRRPGQCLRSQRRRHCWRAWRRVSSGGEHEFGLLIEWPFMGVRRTVAQCCDVPLGSIR